METDGSIEKAAANQAGMQPTAALSPSNILGSPSSTYAGIGIAAATVGNMMMQQQMPTSTTGWVGFGLAMAMSILSMFSRSSIPRQ